MNNLHLRAVRHRTSNIFHLRTASNGVLSRPRHAVPVDTSCKHAAPLHIRWFRNAVSGVLECRWVANATVEPPMRESALPVHAVVRMHRRTRRASLRPPSH